MCVCCCVAADADDAILKLPCGAWLFRPGPPCRQLEALIRISESFARMSLAGEADDGHVAAAFDLFTKSTINAMNAGLISSSTERLEVSWRVNPCVCVREKQ